MPRANWEQAPSKLVLYCKVVARSALRMLPRDSHRGSCRIVHSCSNHGAQYPPKSDCHAYHPVDCIYRVAASHRRTSRRYNGSPEVIRANCFKVEAAATDVVKVTFDLRASPFSCSTTRMNPAAMTPMPCHMSPPRLVPSGKPLSHFDTRFSLLSTLHQPRW